MLNDDKDEEGMPYVPGLDDEAMAQLNEYRKQMAALLPKENSQPIPEKDVQKALDANFDLFLEKEYADDQIGELDEDQTYQEDQVNEKLLLGAVDEFIENKRMRFRTLYRQHGQLEVAEINGIMVARNAEQLRELDMAENENPEEVMKQVREKALTLNEQYEETAADSTPFDEEPPEEEQWDAETILSTYTNTDNHPGVIKTTRRVKPSSRMKIELHKAFKVPIDGLAPIAEEIIIQKEKKAKERTVGPYEKAASSDSDSNEAAEPSAETTVDKK